MFSMIDRMGWVLKSFFFFVGKLEGKNYFKNKKLRPYKVGSTNIF